LQDLEASLPFALLGLDSDNGGEFINHHVLHWLQKRPQPVFMTRSRPTRKTTTRTGTEKLDPCPAVFWL
jgi:hypothetical protein